VRRRFAFGITVRQRAAVRWHDHRGRRAGDAEAGGQVREATITQAPHFSPFHPGADPSYVNTFRRSWGYYDELWSLKSVKSSDRLDLRLASSFEQPDDLTTIVKMQPSKFQFERMLARKYSNLLPILSTVDHYGWYSYLRGTSDDYLPTGYQITRWLNK
jgi:hypothetical protein